MGLLPNDSPCFCDEGDDRSGISLVTQQQKPQQERHFLSERSVKLLIDSPNMADMNLAAFLDRYQQSQAEAGADCTVFLARAGRCLCKSFTFPPI